MGKFAVGWPRIVVVARPDGSCMAAYWTQGARADRAPRRGHERNGSVSGGLDSSWGVRIEVAGYGRDYVGVTYRRAGLRAARGPDEWCCMYAILSEGQTASLAHCAHIFGS